MRLADKVAVITGGGAGIGKAICQLFAEEGAQVIVVDRNSETGIATATEINQAGGSAEFVRCDVQSEEEIQQLAQHVEQQQGQLDILVNNAAIFVLKGIEATKEDWNQSLSVNVVGTALVTQNLLPLLKKSRSASIVNLGSISSFIAQPEFITYSATKSAITSLTRCLALDLAADNIRVNAVCPGTVWTPIVERLTQEAGLTRKEADAHPEWGAAHMLPRIAEAREIANAALFLASDEASFITAECLMVDGGYSAK